VVTIILAPGMHILPRLGLTVAAYLAAASILPLIGRNPLRTPLATWGMAVAHFGIAIALAGMGANAAFTSERLAIAKPGDTLSVGPWLVRLDDVMPAAGKNWTAIQAELRASRGSGAITLEPETRYFSDPPMETNEAAIRTFWNGQLYTVVGKEDASGAWQLRLWWKPFVTLIWAGGALIALGGALALGGRLWRRRRRRGAGDEWRKERYA
jgi:cytochrome c-type biogenesis protein CcmF